MAAAQVNLRIDPDLLARIDANANQHGQTRTEYLLSWLPETYEPDTNQAAKPATNDRR